MTALPVAELETATLPLFYIAWLDFAGDPVRATTFPGGLSFAPGATGDPDLDGDSFIHVPGGIVEISGAVHQTGGSDQLTATLSGLPGPDDDLLTVLATPASWQGRIGRLWHGTHDGSGGGLVVSPYYTGFMMAAQIAGAPGDGIRVTVTLENYLASLTAARGRTYQDQPIYDAGDKSAARIRAAANGVKGAGVGPGTGTGGGGGASQQNVSAR